MRNPYVLFDEFGYMKVRRVGGLGVEVAMEHGLVKVVSPTRGVPAAGRHRSGDIITHLYDAAIKAFLSQATEKMRGTVNTAVRLRIVRGRTGLSRCRSSAPGYDCKELPIFKSSARMATS